MSNVNFNNVNLQLAPTTIRLNSKRRLKVEKIALETASITELDVRGSTVFNFLIDICEPEEIVNLLAGKLLIDEVAKKRLVANKGKSTTTKRGKKCLKKLG